MYDRSIFIYVGILIIIVLLAFFSQFFFKSDNAFEQTVEKFLQKEFEID